MNALFGQNLTSFDIYTQFCLSTSQSENSVSHGIYIFLQPPYLQRYDMQMQQMEKVHLYVIVSTLLVDQLLVLVDRF